MRSARVARWLPGAMALAVGTGALVWFVTDGDGSVDDSDDPGEPPALAVESSSIYQFQTLGELVATSDLVVVGEVIGTERGAVVGDPGGGAIVTRVVTVSARDVLAGPERDTVIVEEEGWLADGTPLMVDGLAPSAAGDRGIWFLDAVPSADAERYVVVNHQGRYLVDPTRPDGLLVGASDDALVAELAALGLDGLTSSVSALDEP